MQVFTEIIHRRRFFEKRRKSLKPLFLCRFLQKLFTEPWFSLLMRTHVVMGGKRIGILSSSRSDSTPTWPDWTPALHILLHHNRCSFESVMRIRVCRGWARCSYGVRSRWVSPWVSDTRSVCADSDGAYYYYVSRSWQRLCSEIVRSSAWFVWVSYCERLSAHV